jgi:hypothetical protein
MARKAVEERRRAEALAAQAAGMSRYLSDEAAWRVAEALGFVVGEGGAPVEFPGGTGFGITVPWQQGADAGTEELLAAVRSLRAEVERWKSQAGDVKDKLARAKARRPAPQTLRAELKAVEEDNDRLREDNERLRSRLRAKRKKLPTDVMHFGRHQGERLSEVPTDYLRWAVGYEALRPKHRAKEREPVLRELDLRSARDEDD